MVSTATEPFKFGNEVFEFDDEDDDEEEDDDNDEDEIHDVISSESPVECFRLLCEQLPALSSRSSSAEQDARLRLLAGLLIKEEAFELRLFPWKLPLLAKLSTREKLDVRLLIMLLIEEMLLLHNKSNLEPFVRDFGLSRPSIGVGGSGLSAARPEIAAIGLVKRFFLFSIEF